jgi:hypothetical protein
VNTARRSVLVLVLIALCLGAAASPAMARSKHFRTPSHKIICLYKSSGGPGPYIRCDALFLNDTAFFLKKTGKSKRRHVTDSVNFGHPRTLRYGRSLRLGRYTCASRRSGLKCKHRKTGHGFKISRKKQRVF